MLRMPSSVKDTKLITRIIGAPPDGARGPVSRGRDDRPRYQAPAGRFRDCGRRGKLVHRGLHTDGVAQPEARRYTFHLWRGYFTISFKDVRLD
jgi:hypothetical protein